MQLMRKFLLCMYINFKLSYTKENNCLKSQRLQYYVIFNSLHQVIYKSLKLIKQEFLWKMFSKIFILLSFSTMMSIVKAFKKSKTKIKKVLNTNE